MHEVPTGTQVFDWTVPQEWNIRDAYVKDRHGRRVDRFRGEQPARRRLQQSRRRANDARRAAASTCSRSPSSPTGSRYRTSYYRETWGFCLSHNARSTLEDGEYEVCIDARSTTAISRTASVYLPGEQEDEVLVSAHICHPSLANDNLSGIAVATLLARTLTELPRRLSYRFVFVPARSARSPGCVETGRDAEGQARARRSPASATAGRPTYKRSRRGDAEIDRAVEHVLRHSGADYEIVDFSPYGYDERQYCSPGFDLPVGCFMRTPWGAIPSTTPRPTTSTSSAPRRWWTRCPDLLAAFSVVDGNAAYVNLNPQGEPQLGRRGLYRSAGGRKDESARELALLWVLNLSDSRHTLLDIAERSGLEFGTVRAAADALIAAELLEEVPR